MSSIQVMNVYIQVLYYMLYKKKCTVLCNLIYVVRLIKGNLSLSTPNPFFLAKQGNLCS
jgi:hypothetical protein